MGKSVNIQVARDHLERLTKASGTNALMELIWNSLDADSKNINITAKEGSLGITQIIVEDNGNGINYQEAEAVFGTLGGSAKKVRRLSPGNRKLHGEEGKGRFKSLSLANLVKFESTYKDNGSLKYFDITIDANNIQGAEISDVRTLKKGEGATGVKVTLNNINQDCASVITTDKIYQQIEEKLAVYYLAYPDFSISINKRNLDFQHFIKRKFEDEFKVKIDNSEKEISFKIRILEWSIQNDRNIFLCNQAGISYSEIPLRIKAPSFNISIYLLSDYIDEIHKTGNIDFGENEPVLRLAIEAARESARKYVRDRMHEDAKGFIEEAKKEGIYPYHGKAASEIENVQRKVFDILALNINEYVPKFSEQEKENKKFTFSLVKEALESDSKSLQKIISEAIKMPKTKQDELAEILEKTSLADITTVIKEVSDRLRVLYELKLILLEPKTRDKVLERKHLHQIVKHNTWVFGDDYSLGVEDVNLKNVLKSHLQLLGRDDFQAVLDEKDNAGLKDIPDICLYKQFPRGKSGYFENFVLELKRPSKKSGITELDQVKRYAQAISTDGRFDMKKNEWTVILLVTDMDGTLEFEYEQDGKPLGEIIKKKNLTVLVKKWIDVLSDAEARYQYLKEKLNYSISHDEEGIKLLKARYAEYLPEEIQR
ncbi:ATP-binding protein [Pleomorphovibrio marinus]|uniref:ATP-binding protein n=1 Tax=Pleomorphovibrio marinus TaxID=2164132 RepID=UPI000E0C0B5A|nr:ATP-binding protein [Pleomorphovibrio marinus]